MNGAALIAAERKRQVEQEGWTSEWDEQYGAEELVAAACCYAAPLRERERVLGLLWPWDPSWWKPTLGDRVRELVKAGALIAAEIDRLQHTGALLAAGNTPPCDHLIHETYPS